MAENATKTESEEDTRARKAVERAENAAWFGMPTTKRVLKWLADRQQIYLEEVERLKAEDACSASRAADIFQKDREARAAIAAYQDVETLVMSAQGSPTAPAS